MSLELDWNTLRAAAEDVEDAHGVLAGQEATEAINRIASKMARAIELLREFGRCDPYSGQPYDEVVEFLAEFDA